MKTIAIVMAAAFACGASFDASSQTRSDSNPQGSQTSPVRGIERGPRPANTPDNTPDDRSDRGSSPQRPPEIQTIDGSGNNLQSPLIGAAHTPLHRRVPADYDDGVASLAGSDRPSPREISNIVHAQEASIPNRQGYTDYLWQWGQFLDHDIDLTDGVDPAEPNAIPIPAGDAFFDPQGTGNQVMDFNRSTYDSQTGTGPDNPRQQINEITAWIDASNVYGSDEVRAAALRELDGSGRLKTSDGNLLPFNVAGLPNAGGPSPALFLAGDVRANEQVGLTAMHTLFVREHNRLAERFAEANPDLDGDAIYQRARRRVAALMQVITYREFLPALLGRNAIRRYRGYDPSVDAGIRNVFSTAAYRLGHTLLSPLLLRVEADGAESTHGHLSLADAFFRPSRLTDEGGIEPILRGLAAQVCQSVDVFVIDEVRNFLFGLPGSGGFDLASLNIQRGRDHGLGNYLDTRAAFGLPPVQTMDDITANAEVAQRLEEAFGSPANMDLWSAALAEDPVRGAMVGPLLHAILVEQFTALRDGDRFWYQNVFGREEARRLENTRLSDVIRRNTDIGAELPDNVFRPGRRDQP